jgi:hypothetical protein
MDPPQFNAQDLLVQKSNAFKTPPLHVRVAGMTHLVEIANLLSRHIYTSSVCKLYC